MKVYAFDVDETLEISRGPVTFASLVTLRNEGHVVGLCGNWALITQNMQNWWHLFSFFGTMGEYHRDGFRADKTDMLANIKRYVPANDWIMVGNILGISGLSDDKGSAERAGWRFIQESSFAAGER